MCWRARAAGVWCTWWGKVRSLSRVRLWRFTVWATGEVTGMCLEYDLKLSYSLVSWTPDLFDSPLNSLILPFIFLAGSSFFLGPSMVFTLILLSVLLNLPAPLGALTWSHHFTHSLQADVSAICVLTWSHPSTQPVARHLYKDGSWASHGKSTSKTEPYLTLSRKGTLLNLTLNKYSSWKTCTSSSFFPATSQKSLFVENVHFL